MRPWRRGAFSSGEGERWTVGGKILGVGGGWEKRARLDEGGSKVEQRVGWWETYSLVE